MSVAMNFSNHWARITLGEACDLLNGRAFRPTDWSQEGRPIIRIQNLNNPRAPYNYFAGSVRPEHEVEPGDLLFAWSGTPGTSFGAHVWHGPRAVLNQHIFKVVIKGNCFDKDFLHLVLNERLREFVAQAQGGVGLAHITKGKLESTELPLPPLNEQRRIAAKTRDLLATSRAARAALGSVPALLDQYRQALFATAFRGDLTRDWREAQQHPGLGADVPCGVHDDAMPPIPETWRYVSVQDVADPGTVVTYGIVLPGPEVPGGVPYVRQQDIEGGSVRTGALGHTSAEIAAKHSRSALRKGDVLLCIIRHLRVAVVPSGIDGANITQGTVRIRPAPFIDAHYLATFLEAPAAQEWMKRCYIGMAMPRINVKDARAVPVAVPPLAEQHEIMRRISMTLAVVQRRLDEATSMQGSLDTLDRALLRRAFTGELVPQNPADEPGAALLERLNSERPLRPGKPRRATASVEERASAELTLQVAKASGV